MIIKGTDAYLFCRMLYEINQDFKEKEKLYTIKDGMFINFDSTRLSQVTAKFVGAKKEAHLSKYFDKLNCCVDGISFFTFFDDYKKNIVEVDIQKKHFIIRTDVPEVEYVSATFNPEVNYNEYKRFMEKVDIDNLDMKFRKEIDSDLVLKISKSKYPIRFSIKKVPLIVTYKLFPGLKKHTILTINGYKLKGNKYLIQAMQEQKKYTSYVYFVIQKY